MRKQLAAMTLVVVAACTLTGCVLQLPDIPEPAAPAATRAEQAPRDTGLGDGGSMPTESPEVVDVAPRLDEAQYDYTTILDERWSFVFEGVEELPDPRDQQQAQPGTRLVGVAVSGTYESGIGVGMFYSDIDVRVTTTAGETFTYRDTFVPVTLISDDIYRLATLSPGESFQTSYMAVQIPQDAQVAGVTFLDNYGGSAIPPAR